MTKEEFLKQLGEKDKESAEAIEHFKSMLKTLLSYCDDQQSALESIWLSHPSLPRESIELTKKHRRLLEAHVQMRARIREAAAHFKDTVVLANKMQELSTAMILKLFDTDPELSAKIAGSMKKQAAN